MSTLTLTALQTASSLQRFCLRRAELFRTTHSLVNQAPFDPDKKQFLQVSQVLGRFVPVEDDVSRLVRCVSEDRRDVPRLNAL